MNAAANPVVVARLTRAWKRALRQEENATTVEVAWRFAAEATMWANALAEAKAGKPTPKHLLQNSCCMSVKKLRALKKATATRRRNCAARYNQTQNATLTTETN